MARSEPVGSARPESGRADRASRRDRAWFVLLAVALVVTVAAVALAGPSTKRIVFEPPAIMPVIAVLTVIAVVLLAGCILIALWRRPEPSAAARVCVALVALVVAVIARPKRSRSLLGRPSPIGNALACSSDSCPTPSGGPFKPTATTRYGFSPSAECSTTPPCSARCRPSWARSSPSTRSGPNSDPIRAE